MEMGGNINTQLDLCLFLTSVEASESFEVSEAKIIHDFSSTDIYDQQDYKGTTTQQKKILAWAETQCPTDSGLRYSTKNIHVDFPTRALKLPLFPRLQSLGENICTTIFSALVQAP